MEKNQTREAKEYEAAMKNLHELSLKKAMSEDGIDTSKISQKTFDEVRRLVDKQSYVRQKYQQIITKAQQEAQAAINKVQQDMQMDLQEVQKEIEDAVKQIKVEQGVILEEKLEVARGEEKEAAKQPEKI